MIFLLVQQPSKPNLVCFGQVFWLSSVFTRYSLLIVHVLEKQSSKVRPDAILIIKNREMIFEQPLCNNFCDNFLFYTHILFLLFLSIVLVFVSIFTFLCIF